jgi:hypothetical protein
LDETPPLEVPPPVLPEVDRGPGDALDIPASTSLWLALASFLLVLVLFLTGQIIQLMNMPLGLTVTSLAIFGAAGLFFPALFNLKPTQFTGLAKNPSWFPVLSVLLATVNLPFANFLMAGMSELLPASWSVDAKETTRLLLAADHLSRALIVIAAGVAAPIGEELFFRGWLQPLLSRRLGTFVSVLTTAVAFSFIHFDPVGFVARVELGILFGLARVWTGSLWPAMAMHATHNLISTAALYFAADPQAQIDMPLELKSDAPVAVLSLVLTLGVAQAYRQVTLGAATPPVNPVPFRFTWRPAFRIAARNFVVVAVATTLLGVFRERLPGAELTQSIWHRLFGARTSAPAQVPDAEERRGHLK